MRTRIGIIIGMTVLLAGFQNCARIAPGAGDSGVTPQKVVGSAAQYKKISYDPQLEMMPGSSVLLQVNLEDGTMALSGQSCSLDNSRLDTARTLLQQSQICEPGPMEGDTVCTMVYPLADIRLSNGLDSILLRPFHCDIGTGLCGDNDQKLRDLISDLRTNPPAGCN